MSILLIRPRGPQFNEVVGPDLGLGYLQTALNKADIDVTIIDLFWQDYDNLREVLRKHDFSQIGFKLFSKDVSHFREILDVIRDEYNNERMPPLIAGGPLPTGLGGAFLHHFPEFDYAFQGEAEIGYPLLAAQLEDSPNKVDPTGIPGLIYRNGQDNKVNLQDFPKDLDALGFPDYSQMPPDRYRPDSTTGNVYIPIITTRGCPYSCTYCAGPLSNGHKMRRRSPEHVLEEIEMLKKQYGISMFSIADDNLTMVPSHARAIFEGLINRRLNIRWRAPNGIRLDTLDKELVRLIEQSGCVELFLGIDSGSPPILKDMNRKVELDTYREKIELLAKETRIRLMGLFILGYPTEREEDILNTIQFAVSLQLKGAAFFFFTPHPGTKIYDEMLANGEIPDNIWDSMFYDRPTIGTRHISYDRLRQLHHLAHRKFYFRLPIIKDVMKKFLSPRQFFPTLRKAFGVILQR